MTVYDPPSVVEKRVRFFDGQFLVDQDFIDEQNYHVDRERRHNRLLHVAGIAEGLAVAATVENEGLAVAAAENQVTVQAGTAIDPDGRQLVLARDTLVDLPAERFNGIDDVRLYAAYRESAEDQQTEIGSADYTRWLEEPQLLALLPDEEDQEANQSVLLARLALDNSGRVTVDNSVRKYSGARLPGPTAEAPTLRTGADGQVSLDASLTVVGDLGVGTTEPTHELSVNGRMSIEHGVIQRGGNLITGTTDLGLYSLYDEDPIRLVTYRGPVRFYSDGGAGTRPNLSVESDGNVGIGTTEPIHKLSVNGRMSVEDGVIQRGGDPVVDTSDLGLYSQVSGNWIRLVTNEGPIRFFTDGGKGTIPRISVGANGDVGIGTTNPTHRLGVNGRMSVEHGVIQRGGDPVVDTSDLGLYSQVSGSWVRLVTNEGPIGFFTDGGSGKTPRISVGANGDVGIGTTNPTHRLGINGRMSVEDGVIQRGGDPVVDTSDLGLYSQIPWSWIRLVTKEGPIRFFTDGGSGKTARMSVEGNGNVGIGTTSPTHKLSVNGRMSVEHGVIQRGGDPVVDTSDLGLYSQVSGNWIRLVTNEAPIRFFTDGDSGKTAHMSVEPGGNVGIGTTDTAGQRLRVQGGSTWLEGNLYLSGDLAIPWSGYWWKVHLDSARGSTLGGPSLSDVRLKTAIRPIGDALDTVLRLKGSRFRWGEDGVEYFTKDIPNTLLAGPGVCEEENRRVWDAKRQEAAQALAGDRIGLVAQDVEAVVPEVVHTDEDGYKHIRYGQLTALLVEAVKEQHAAVTALSGRVATLEGAAGRSSS